MGFTLSLSTNPFVNRFAEPEELVRVLAGEVGIGRVQLTHEFIDPAWPAALRRRTTDRMAQSLRRGGLAVTSMMTGPYGRLNHFGHPDPEARAHSVAWFKALADIAADLGCPAIGTQYAILTFRDYDDPARRAARLAEALDCWRAVAEHAAARGLAWLFWEPMSVGRELGHTQASTRALQAEIDAARCRSRCCRWSTSTTATCPRPTPPTPTPTPGRATSRRARPSSTSSRVDDEQGRPLALHGGAQPGRPHPARAAARRRAGGRRHRQRALPRTRLARARAERPGRGARRCANRWPSGPPTSRRGRRRAA